MCKWKNLARKAGVGCEVLQAVLACDPGALPPPLADTYRFVDAVVRVTGEDGALRGAVVGHYGRDGLAELALAIGASRFLPVVKRTMGHATACAHVTVEEARLVTGGRADARHGPRRRGAAAPTRL